jgi:hypothetical protein
VRAMEAKNKIPKYLQLDYIDNCIQQNMLWVNGKSLHKNDECVLDFSCCHPELKRDEDFRVKHGTQNIIELIERRMTVLSNKD